LWCDKFYGDHLTFTVSKVLPIAATVLAFREVENPDQTAEAATRIVAAQYIGASLAAVRECDPAELPATIETWEETKTEELTSLLLNHFGG